MREVTNGWHEGITVGKRKDGSVAILWEDDEITWHTATEILDLLV